MDAWSAAPPISATDPNALRNRRPNKVIPVPQEFRRLSHLAERNTLVNDIKTSTGCTVVPQCDQGRVLQFGIIGAGAGLEKAIRQINEWISNAHVKSKDSSAWAKMPAFDVNKWYYEQVTEMELQHKQIFKGPIHEAAEGEAPLPSVSPFPVLVTKSDETRSSCTGRKPLSTRAFSLETSSAIS
jgi:hypothetical protein